MNNNMSLSVSGLIVSLDFVASQIAQALKALVLHAMSTAEVEQFVTLHATFGHVLLDCMFAKTEDEDILAHAALMRDWLCQCQDIFTGKKGVTDVVGVMRQAVA